MNYEERIAELHKQIDKLKEEMKNPFKRVDEGEYYYTVVINWGKATVISAYDVQDNYNDETRFKNNNYFLTKERAKEVTEKINALLKLERIHDMVCPEYEPNWTDHNEEKCCITVEPHCKKVEHTVWYVTNQTPSVYFPTDKIDEAIKLYDEMC